MGEASLFHPAHPSVAHPGLGNQELHYHLPFPHLPRAQGAAMRTRCKCTRAAGPGLALPPENEGKSKFSIRTGTVCPGWDVL